MKTDSATAIPAATAAPACDPPAEAALPGPAAAPPAAPAPVLPQADSAPTARRLDRRYVTAALMLVMVLASMEMTITSTAMPTIIGDLHGLEHYSWVASVY